MNYKSTVDNLTIKQIKKIIKISSSISDMVTKIGLRKTSAQTRKMRDKLLKEGFDLKKLQADFYKKRNESFAEKRKIPLEQLLVKNSKLVVRDRKEEIFSKGLLKNECYDCKTGPFWQGKPLNLQFDHINGDHSDNRIENLRVLCPNCHAQTKTFSGKNLSKLRTCVGCETKQTINNAYNLCESCFEEEISKIVIKKFKSFSEFERVVNTEILEEVVKKYNFKRKTLHKAIKILSDKGEIHYIRNNKNKVTSKQSQNQFYEKIHSILILLNHNLSKKKICSLLEISRKTLDRYLKREEANKIKLDISPKHIPVKYLCELLEKEPNMTKIANQFNCSDNALVKKLKKEAPKAYFAYSSRIKVFNKECEVCDKLFKPSNKGGRFCSVNCAQTKANESYFKYLPKIIKLYKKGFTALQISQNLCLPRTTVRAYLVKYEKMNNYSTSNPHSKR